MFLVQILLPLERNDGTRQPAHLYAALRDELVARYGGLTAHSRAPAVGLWNGDGAGTSRDEVVLIEVMTPALDRAWWTAFRHRLERDFEQSSVVVRAMRIEQL